LSLVLFWLPSRTVSRSKYFAHVRKIQTTLWKMSLKIYKNYIIGLLNYLSIYFWNGGTIKSSRPIQIIQSEGEKYLSFFLLCLTICLLM
jgi:hypothetical protein